jgi:hypothetical protein
MALATLLRTLMISETVMYCGQSGAQAIEIQNHNTKAQRTQKNNSVLFVPLWLSLKVGQ